jgi:hypothetical protein
VALDPSAHIPHKPNTERKEQLKIYGEAELTVSLSTETVAISNVDGAGNTSLGISEVTNVNVFRPTTSLTVNEPLYAPGDCVIPRIMMGVSTANP